MSAPEIAVLYADPIVQHYYEMSHLYGDAAEFVAAFPPELYGGTEPWNVYADQEFGGAPQTESEPQ